MRSHTLSSHRRSADRAGDPAHLPLQGGIAARADAAGLALIYVGEGDAEVLSALRHDVGERREICVSLIPEDWANRKKGNLSP